jgi:hypothetical protein
MSCGCILHFAFYQAWNCQIFLIISFRNANNNLRVLTTQQLVMPSSESSSWTFPTDSPGFLTDESLHEAYELEIKTKDGDTVRFGELVAGKGDTITTIVIFGESLSVFELYWSHKLQSATSFASTTNTTFDTSPRI